MAAACAALACAILLAPHPAGLAGYALAQSGGGQIQEQYRRAGPPRQRLFPKSFQRLGPPRYLHPIPRSMRIPRTPYRGTPGPHSGPALPQGFTMVRVWKAGGSVDRAAAVNSPREIADRLAACWSPPAIRQQASPGDPPQVTIRMALRSDGKPVAEPRITYIGGVASDSERALMRASILAAVDFCTPFRFTRPMASAIAGRPVTIRFIAPARAKREPAAP